MSSLIQAVRCLEPRVRVRTLQGQPIRIGEREILPVVRSVTLTLGRRGALGAGWVWNRPLAVLDVHQGRVRRIPIPDVTRQIALLGLLASTLLLWLAVSHVRQKHKRKGGQPWTSS